jgi:hypothetical protein
VVSWGATTAHAHLDPLDPVDYPLDPAELPGREIDWDEVLQWLRTADASTGRADFAGRYFLGTATQDEVNAAAGFCLWAHGEAAGPDSPTRIVPLQRADPARQSATGDQGVILGFQDATALAAQLDRCLAVGDLEIVGTKEILVFLEVADATPISAEYWASWASTLHDAVVVATRHANRAGAPTTQPFLPAILCAFPFDAAAGLFMPEAGVRACLDVAAPPGLRSHCHGLWARRLSGDPGLQAHSFSWENIGEYRQPRRFLGIEAYLQRVPVRYLRWFDGPGGLPIPAGPLRDTLSLLTLDWAATEDDDDPRGFTLTPTNWTANRRVGGNLVELPSQLGFDASATVTDASAACLGGTGVVVSALPYHGANQTPVALLRPCELAIRYYRPAGARRIGANESLALSLAGIQIAVVWQHTATLVNGWAPYVNDLIAPFLNGQGRNDGLTAFNYAADTIDQPPYTPVYFAIDFPVGDPGYTDNQPGSVPVATPGLATILDYFADVHRGYRDYLVAHPTTPYYVGAYTQPDTAAALYRAGLVSHVWQPPWGPSTPFPHLNVWQIGMDWSAQALADNPALQACRPAGQPAGTFWVDLDCAWGDPGGFHVL